MLRVIPWNTTVILFALAVTAVLLLGVRYYLIDEITLGTLFLIYQYTQMLNDPIEMLGDQVQEFQKRNPACCAPESCCPTRARSWTGSRKSCPKARSV